MVRRLFDYPRIWTLLVAVTILTAALSALTAQAYPPIFAPFTSHLRRYLTHQWQSLFSPQTGLLFGAMAIVLVIEVAAQGYRGSALARLIQPTRSTVQDIFCFAVGALGFSGLLITIFSLDLAGLGANLLGRVAPAGALSFKDGVVQMIWLLVAVDFFKYWMHRFQHAVPMWWEAHKFHHAATELNVITTARGHPLDGAFRYVYLAVPMAMLGSTVDQFLLVALVLNMHAGLTHSMLNWRWGWVGRWVLVSPVVHRIHHSDMPEHFDKNFGAILVIWDRIFGTYYEGTAVNVSVGVTANPYNRRDFVSDLILCAVNIVKATRATLSPHWVRGLLPDRSRASERGGAPS